MTAALQVGTEVTYIDGAGEQHIGTIRAIDRDKNRVTITETKNGHRWTNFPVQWVLVPMEQAA